MAMNSLGEARRWINDSFASCLLCMGDFGPCHLSHWGLDKGLRARARQSKATMQRGGGC